MKGLLYLCLAISAPLRAETVECPRSFPWKDTQLSEVPHGHRGLGIVAKGDLNGAAMFGGANRDLEPVGIPSKVKGGENIGYTFSRGDTKWLLCTYGAGGDIQWWERIDSETAQCVVEVRGKVPHMSARAVCR